MDATIAIQNRIFGAQRSPAVRVTFLAVMPAPYMIDFFEAINEDPRFDLTVYFLEKPAVAAPGVYWLEKPLPSYSAVLPGRWFYFRRARVHLNAGLFRAIDRSRPEIVVVLGYSSLTCQFAMYWLWMKRIPWVFWGEVPGFERRGVVGSVMRWLALRPVAWLSKGIAAIGVRAATAYRQIAGRTRPVANIPYYCRNDALLKIDRDKNCGPEAAHFLYCGQIVVRKGVDVLIRAFGRVAQDHPEVRLTLVGDGPMRAELTAAVPDPIRSRVTWAGFREAEDLPPFFAEANVFVLPSIHDGWGVVINQAVSAGMAVIASDAVGAAVDLVTDGSNGRIFPSQNELALEKSLRFFAENPEAIVRFGQVSRSLGQEIRPERGVERWYRFLEQILHNRGGSSSRSREVTQCTYS